MSGTCSSRYPGCSAVRGGAGLSATDGPKRTSPSSVSKGSSTAVAPVVAVADTASVTDLEGRGLLASDGSSARPRADVQVEMARVMKDGVGDKPGVHGSFGVSGCPSGHEGRRCGRRVEICSAPQRDNNCQKGENMDRCKKCARPLQTCQGCGGKPGRSPLGDPLTCNRCNTTGKVCPEHNGGWK
jgi:hypothetical protein